MNGKNNSYVNIVKKPHNINMLLEFAESNDSSDRLGALLCLRRAGADLSYNIMKKYLFFFVYCVIALIVVFLLYFVVT